MKGYPKLYLQLKSDCKQARRQRLNDMAKFGEWGIPIWHQESRIRRDKLQSARQLSVMQPPPPPHPIDLTMPKVPSVAIKLLCVVIKLCCSLRTHVCVCVGGGGGGGQGDVNSLSRHDST